MKKQMKPVTDERLVAYCGLYCGSCGRYLKGKCPGCAENEKASWCGVRTCNKSLSQKSCAECTKYSDIMACRDFNNPISKIIGFVLRSDRKACIERIRAVGTKEYASEMAESGRQTNRR